VTLAPHCPGLQQPVWLDFNRRPVENAAGLGSFHNQLDSKQAIR
jgi:hypothetical protein